MSTKNQKKQLTKLNRQKSPTKHMAKRREVATRLVKFRKDNYMTQQVLASRIGIKRTTLSRWETGRTTMSPAMAKLLEMEGVL